MMREFKIDKALSIKTPKDIHIYLASISKFHASPEDETNKTENMILGNLPFVVSVAKQYAGYHVPIEDIIQYGNEGLLKAAERFDPTKGFKFISYAIWWIRQSIITGIQDERMIRIPGNKNNLNNEAKRKLEKFMQENHIEVSSLPDLAMYETEVSRIDDFVNEDHPSTIADKMGKCDHEYEYNLQEKVKDIIFKFKFMSGIISNARIQNFIYDYLRMKVFEDLDEPVIKDFLSEKYNITEERTRQLIALNIVKLRTCPAIIELIA